MLARKPTHWVTVLENVAHPGHDGVRGDLCYHPVEHRYQLLEWNPTAENYVAHSVPHAWAVSVDPATTAPQPETCQSCGFVGVTVFEGACGACKRASIQLAALDSINSALRG